MIYVSIERDLGNGRRGFYGCPTKYETVDKAAEFLKLVEETNNIHIVVSPRCAIQ